MGATDLLLNHSVISNDPSQPSEGRRAGDTHSFHVYTPAVLSTCFLAAASCSAVYGVYLYFRGLTDYICVLLVPFVRLDLSVSFPGPAGNTAFSSRGSIRPTSSTSAAHTAGIMQTGKTPKLKHFCRRLTICLLVCSIYTCIILVYDYQHASACINIHVNLWSRSFACGQISGTAAANSDLVPD